MNLYGLLIGIGLGLMAVSDTKLWRGIGAVIAGVAIMAMKP